MKEYKTDDLVKEISELRKRMATLREDNRKLRHELFQKSVKRRASHFYSEEKKINKCPSYDTFLRFFEGHCYRCIIQNF